MKLTGTPVVYRAYDEHGFPLYFVSTVNLPGRLEHHASNAYWWQDGLSIEVTMHLSVKAARAVEAAEIREVRPRFNLAGRPPRAEWTAADHVEFLMAYRAGPTNRSRWELVRQSLSAKFPEIAEVVLPAIPLPRNASGERGSGAYKPEFLVA